MPTEISVFLLSLQAMPLKLTTYYRGSKVPDLPGTNTFHPTELFRIYEETPGYTPILIVASEEDKPVAKLLAAIRKSIRMFPPGIIKRCEVYGMGEYFDNEADKEAIFSDMLQRLTKCHVRIQIFPGQPIHRHQLATGAQLTAQRRKGGRAFQPVTYPANKERPQKRCPSAGSTYQRGDSLFCPDVAPRIFFQDTAPLPQHQVLSASRKPIDKRETKQNLHRHL